MWANKSVTMLVYQSEMMLVELYSCICLYRLLDKRIELSFRYQVVSSYISCSVFIAKYESHVLEELPVNWNESEFSHGPRSTAAGNNGDRAFFLHSCLHVAGQKNLTFFPVPGCSFLHLVTGFFCNVCLTSSSCMT